MKTIRVMVVAAVIIASGLVLIASGLVPLASGLGLHVTRAQQPGITRIDLQRHDLSVPGREVVQTIVEI